MIFSCSFFVLAILVLGVSRFVHADVAVEARRAGHVTLVVQPLPEPLRLNTFCPPTHVVGVARAVAAAVHLRCGQPPDPVVGVFQQNPRFTAAYPVRHFRKTVTPVVLVLFQHGYRRPAIPRRVLTQLPDRIAGERQREIYMLEAPEMVRGVALHHLALHNSIRKYHINQH